MTAMPRSTLEQWAVLRAIVREGGFAAAALALNRSQSSVSYAVARLREALGVDLLTLEGRRAVLTPAGEALLAEATPLIDALEQVERRGRGIAGGEPVRVRLLVDVLFPRARLFDALAAFTARHPGIDIHLVQTVRQWPDEDLLARHEVAVLPAPGDQIGDATIVSVELLAVAAPGHPLAKARAPGRQRLRHVLAEIRGAQFESVRPPNQRVWLKNTVEGAADAVRRGLCFGWLPTDLIHEDLATGALVPLTLGAGSRRAIPLNLWKGSSEAAASQAVAALADLIRNGPAV
ncbi:LysR family transcriptional regulator [Pseudoxanthomonas winnipegensis]|uniref:LysR family transcriptional regulator n=1 Tax=Pseudoxanthomonas winnipegensis TaxID=2480810 RepID=A0A4V2HFF4_9GAMM|nr:LysR family transcriptional regulator [Pseudoxanthomonas winnipegensis]RZZ90452.1 LysR family transcriptional regulator [Pseudoxanthomonas winnipegensis]TAA37391.1 LysR family transcriptional regulator [Pseudoxanthomonas winnipegensis]